VHAGSGRSIAAGRWPAELPAPLAGAIAGALRDRTATDTDLYRGSDGRMAIDFVVPLAAVPEAAPDVALVLRVDAATRLYPLLDAAPLRSRTAEVVLLRRAGSTAVVLSPLRHVADAPLRVHRELPPGVAWPRGGGGEVLGADGRAEQRLDYRNVLVISWLRAVPGTPWYVAAKIDRDELLAAVHRDSVWIGLAALLALATVAFAIELLHEQRTLRLTRALQQRREEVVRSAQLLHDIAEGATDSIFAKDADGRYLLLNDAAQRLLGITADESASRTDFDLWPREVAERIRADDLRTMQAGETATYEETIETPTGAVQMLTTKGPLRDAQGRVIGVFGISRDVTERTRVARELDGHRNHLEMLVRQRTAELEAANLELQRRAAEIGDLYDNSPCGYDSIDATGLVLRMNDTELRWLGYRREEVVGRRRIPELLTPESAARFAGTMEALARHGAVNDLPVDFVRRDGTLLPAVVSATAIRNADGAIAEVRATVVDATERRLREREVARLAEQLERRAAEAESASRAKSAFLANMSHEIRTPLNAIVGLTYLVRRSNTDAAQLDRLDKIVAAAEHLLGVLNDVLDISKIEAGKLSLESGPVEVHALMQQVGTWTAARAREKRIELVVETPTDVPELVTGDATRLRQLLLNYASNAVKFTERGRIVLRATVAERDDDSVLLRFEVEDTGIGIAPDALPRLFDAFEQGDDSTTRRYGGTGLGLAINRLIAREMGGEVGATSAPGAGSRFWLTARFRLPTVAAVARGGTTGEAADLPDEETLRGAWLGMRVLLAEDNPINREVAEDLLAALGLGVDVAPDGAIAVAKARATRYALVLMDVQMPVMDGLDATRSIRQLDGYASTPIVAMTASATLEDRTAAAAAGMSDFISKPFTPAALARLLMRWLPVTASGRAAQPPRGVRAASGDSSTAVDPAADAATAASTSTVTGLEIVRRLADVPGLDPMRGLPYSGHDGTRYLRFVGRFVASARDELARGRAALERGDAAAVRRALHSIKGAAAFAGATQLRTLAGAAEGRVSTEAGLDGVQPEFAEIERKLERLASAVQAIELATARPVAAAPMAAVESVAASATTATLRPRAVAVLARLEEFLEHGDTAAAGVVDEEREVLQVALGAERAAELARHVDAFEYEAAVRLLHDARHA
jgi:PAS domain S-box-containing protein